MSDRAEHHLHNWEEYLEYKAWQRERHVWTDGFHKPSNCWICLDDASQWKDEYSLIARYEAIMD